MKEATKKDTAAMLKSLKASKMLAEDSETP